MMAKAVKPKRKYPETREKQSNLFQENNVTTMNYTSDPRLEIVIKSELDSTVIFDITNAIDDVLKFHGL